MKQHKFFSVLLAFLFLVFVAPFHVAKTDTHAEATTPSSVFSGISLTRQNTDIGGGVMLDNPALGGQMDMSNATYLAIRYYNPMDGAWPFYFICQQNGGFIYLTEGAQYSIYNDSFELVETKQVAANALAPTPCSSGYIVIPASVFAGMATIQALYITMPDNTAATVQLHFGKVGYYTENTPDLATDMITLTDFSTWTEEWLTGRNTSTDGGVTLALVKESATGKFNGVQIAQTSFTENTHEGLMINRFKTATIATVDITNVQWFAFEYANLSSEYCVGLIQMQDTSNGQYPIATGTQVTFLDRDFTNPRTSTTVDPYMRTAANFEGWVLVPRSAFGNLGNTLAAVYLLMSVYDAVLNGSALQYGRILTYTQAEITDYTAGTVIADPGKWSDADIAARTTGSSATATTFEEGATYTPVAPTKAGSAFIGWKYTDATGTKVVLQGQDITVTANCTIEAVFVDFVADGASAKTSGTTGLRFKNTVTAESKALLESLGITASYGTHVTNATLGYLDIPVVNWFNTDKTTFTAVLKDFAADQYALEFTAQAYVEINGVKYYAEATQTSSLAKVAYTALNDPTANLTQPEIDYLTPIAAEYQA